MHGGHPRSWVEAWGDLAWRHQRPHRPASVVAAPAAAARQPSAAEGAASRPIPQAEKSIHLENGVTGLNNLKKHKERARKDATRRKDVHVLPAHAQSIVVDSLVLISVDKESAEGEMAVGLARAMESCEGGECQFKWYVRKEWCTQPRKHMWSKSPTFRLAADPNSRSRCYVTREPLEKVLPLEVVVTANSKRDNPRLEAECVRMLRELCLQRDLICAERTAQNRSVSVRPSDSSDEDHVASTSEPQHGVERVADRVRAQKRRTLSRRIVIDHESSASEQGGDKSDSSDELAQTSNAPEHQCVVERVADRVRARKRKH